MPSAGEVERFGYCAHNWWLSRQGVEGGHGSGVKEHDRKGREQAAVERGRLDARDWLRWSFRILAVAASATFLALEIIYIQDNVDLDWAFLLMAIVILTMSIGLLVVALITEAEARRKARDAGLIPAELVDSDLAGDAELLHDPEWNITGRPDYIIRTHGGMIPVEVKTGKTPQRPHENHVLQLACYLRLVEVKTGQRPTYGLVTYPDGTFRVEWDDDMRAYLKGTLERMRAATAGGKADRDHEHVGRCRGCARREACDQRLA